MIILDPAAVGVWLPAVCRHVVESQNIPNPAVLPSVIAVKEHGSQVEYTKGLAIVCHDDVAAIATFFFETIIAAFYLIVNCIV